MSAPEVEGFAVRAEGPALTCALTPADKHSADEAVGLVLLPVLMVLVVVSVGYLLAVVVLALAGRDPALALADARPVFVGLGGLTWVGATAWFKLRGGAPTASTLSVALTPGAVALRGEGEGWDVPLAALERAEVRTRSGLEVLLLLRDGEERQIPMLGIGEEAAGWLAAELNQRVGAARAAE